MAAPVDNGSFITLDATAYTGTVTLRAASGSLGYTVTGFSLTCYAQTTAATVQLCSGSTVLAQTFVPVVAATVQPVPWVVTGIRMTCVGGDALVLRTGGGASTVIHGVIFTE